MTTIIFFRRFIALGVKTKGSSSRFGEGHNFTIEAGFRVESKGDEARLIASLDRVLARIDHRALGVDVDLGLDPVPSALAEWIFKEHHGAERETSLCEVHMLRGDGLKAAYFTQP